LANFVALFLGAAALWCLALALLWRLGSWQLSNAATLTLDEGLQAGAVAPELVARINGEDRHLGFVGRETFLVFGTQGCEPCIELLRVAWRLSRPSWNFAPAVV